MGIELHYLFYNFVILTENDVTRMFGCVRANLSDESDTWIIVLTLL